MKGLGMDTPWIPSDADYVLKAFAPENQGGHLVIGTWHRGEVSKDMELRVLRARHKRGEIGRIELVDRKRHVETDVTLPVANERL